MGLENWTTRVTGPAPTGDDGVSATEETVGASGETTAPVLVAGGLALVSVVPSGRVPPGLSGIGFEAGRLL
jgi:hypothetical protein